LLLRYNCLTLDNEIQALVPHFFVIALFFPRLELIILIPVNNVALFKDVVVNIVGLLLNNEYDIRLQPLIEVTCKDFLLADDLANNVY
jgi:hypothetical protein